MTSSVVENSCEKKTSSLVTAFAIFDNIWNSFPDKRKKHPVTKTIALKRLAASVSCSLPKELMICYLTGRHTMIERPKSMMT